MLKLRSSAGYTLVELAVSMSIMLVVMGAIFSLVNPAAGTARVQPEFADMQQRARVGVEALFKDLVIAGAGPYMKNDTNGPQTGSLMNFFAPILPYRTGKIAPDNPGTFKPDTITIVYVPNTPSQTSIRQEMPQNSAELKVEPQDSPPPSNCPQKNPMCGFNVGDGLLIFDKNGKGFDTFEITQVQAPALHLQHRGKDNSLSTTYPAGSMITQVQSHTYYYDAAQNQLRHYDGLQTDVPILDNVVGLEFTYYGDPNPPLGPKPVVGEQNCVIDMAGDPRLPQLNADTGSIVKLPGSLFSSQDGQDLCGGGSNAYDPDLLRIRKVEVRIRVQTGDATMRGTDARFFVKPGRSTGAMVPDYELRFEVSPRNMNLVR